ncbi:transposable element Tcb1 transposase [Trichonephila clavipes]|nr:transposable element Tcb1 transposase [Trichonephila clavipes]
MKLSLLTSHASVCNTPRWSDSRLETPWREDAGQVMHRHTGPAPGIMITPLAATPDQLWQRVEAAWSAVPQEHIQSFFESMPRRVTAVISNNGGYSGY